MCVCVCLCVCMCVCVYVCENEIQEIVCEFVCVRVCVCVERERGVVMYSGQAWPTTAIKGTCLTNCNNWKIILIA